MLNKSISTEKSKLRQFSKDKYDVRESINAEKNYGLSPNDFEIFGDRAPDGFSPKGKRLLSKLPYHIYWIFVFKEESQYDQ